MTLSPEAIKALVWMRDNEFHIGEWLPKNAKPQNCTHMKLSGYTKSIKVRSENWAEISGLLEYSNQDRLFMPNEASLQLIKDAK